MAIEYVPPGIGEGPAKVISVSLPEGTVHALRELGGARGVSAVVASAVEEHLRTLAATAYVDDYLRDHDPFSAAERRAAADIWARAELKEAQWRGGR